MVMRYNVGMCLRRNQISYHAGVSLVETIIGLSLMAFMLLAIFTLITVNYNLLFSSKAKSIGITLAQEKVEELKNMPYDSLSTQRGTIYPAGNIDDEIVESRNNLRFLVKTDIRYVDNNYDGNNEDTVPGQPRDLYPYDYKKITVTTLSPDGRRQYAQISTDIAAKAAETSGNTGVLIVRVIDANGNPVEAATVKVQNSSLSPEVDIITQSDILGRVVIPKLPPVAQSSYHVVIEKAGYSSEQTWPISVGLPSPTNPDFGLQAQQTTMKTFAIDRLASASVQVVSPSGLALPNLNVTITGAKSLNSIPFVPKFSQSRTTDDLGQLNFSLIEWDSYSFSIPGYNILSTTPFSPVAILPNDNRNIKLIVAPVNQSYPQITSIIPSVLEATTNVLIDVYGAQINSGSNVILRKNGQVDIPASAVTFSAPNQLTASFDLTGVASGSWDVIVTTAGLPTTQFEGVTIQ
jgi:hypothetical protein